MSSSSEFVIALEDERRLRRVVQNAMASGDGHRAAFLGNKLHRAVIVPAARVAADRVRMLGNGWYRDEETGAVRDFTLVYPGHQRQTAGLISVLSETGASLLGLRAGQRIPVLRRSGGHRMIELIEVSAPLPDRARPAGRAPEARRAKPT